MHKWTHPNTQQCGTLVFTWIHTCTRVCALSRLRWVVVKVASAAAAMRSAAAMATVSPSSPKSRNNYRSPNSGGAGVSSTSPPVYKFTWMSACEILCVSCVDALEPHVRCCDNRGNMGVIAGPSIRHSVYWSCLLYKMSRACFSVLSFQTFHSIIQNQDEKWNYPSVAWAGASKSCSLNSLFEDLLTTRLTLASLLS